MEINLHTIFSRLVDDDNFLSKVIESDDKKNNEHKKLSFNLMTDAVNDYLPLIPGEKQSSKLFPSDIRFFLTSDFFRIGVKNIIERNLKPINISFLVSFNILLRPELITVVDDSLRNFNLLVSFISHKLERNYNVDKIKNTKKIKIKNKELIKDMEDGKISHELIQIIVNIFEVNLLVFDLIKNDIYFYWTHGNKYPYLNLFRDIFCMAYIQGNYEPIISFNEKNKLSDSKNIYIKILSNATSIKCIDTLNLNVCTLEYLNTWDIPKKSYIEILEYFYGESYIPK